MPRTANANDPNAPKAPRTPRRTKTTDGFPAFVGEVESELAARIGGAGAADFVARDPSFGMIFRLGYDMRANVSNPAKKCAGLIIDALATSIVRDRMESGRPFQDAARAAKVAPAGATDPGKTFVDGDDIRQGTAPIRVDDVRGEPFPAGGRVTD